MIEVGKKYVGNGKQIYTCYAGLKDLPYFACQASNGAFVIVDEDGHFMSCYDGKWTVSTFQPLYPYMRKPMLVVDLGREAVFDGEHHGILTAIGLQGYQKDNDTWHNTCEVEDV